MSVFPSPSPAEKPAQKQSPAATAAAIGGAVVGALFGRYCWMMMMIPGAAAVIAGFILSKTLTPDRKPLVAALAVQIGHGLWMFTGMLFSGQIDLNVIDIAIYIVGLTWLIVAPSWIPAGILIAYQTFGIAMNAIVISQQAVGTMPHKALVTHIGIRVAAIVFMVVAMRTIDKQRRDARYAGEDE